MRIILNLLILVTCCLLLGGALWYQQQRDEELQNIALARDEVSRFERVIMLQAALKHVELNERGYPPSVDPGWFGDLLPRNPLLPESHPWLEIAHEQQMDLLHPPDRVAISRRHARFWYNPYTGRLRARVPARASDAATLALYNKVNRTNLESLFADGRSDGVQEPVEFVDPPRRRRR